MAQIMGILVGYFGDKFLSKLFGQFINELWKIVFDN